MYSVRPVLVGGGHGVGDDGARALVGVDGDARRRVARATTGGSRRSAADACTSSVSSALHTLGRCTLELCTISTAMASSARLVEEDVHHAGAGLDDRHRRLRDDRVDQVGAAARDEHVDVAPRAA